MVDFGRQWKLPLGWELNVSCDNSEMQNILIMLHILWLFSTFYIEIDPCSEEKGSQKIWGTYPKQKMSKLCQEYKFSDPHSSVLSTLPNCLSLLHILTCFLYILTGHTLTQTDSNNVRKSISLPFPTVVPVTLGLLVHNSRLSSCWSLTCGGQGNGGCGKVSKWAILAKAEKFLVSPLHQTIRLVTQITSK